MNTDPATKIIFYTERERPLCAAVLGAMELCTGKGLNVICQAFGLSPSDEPAASADAVRTTKPQLLAQLLQRTWPLPNQRRIIANYLSWLSPVHVPYAPVTVTLGDELATSGLVMLPALLGPAEVDELAQFLRTREDLQMEGTLEKNLVEDVAAAPHALKLALHPAILTLAHRYLGCAPTIINIEGWWSPATGSAGNAPEQLHRDKDDFRACKLFMYLTDVGPEDGPHLYAKRSHDPEYVRSLLPEAQRTDNDVRVFFSMQNGGREVAAANKAIFGDRLTEVTGPRGTAFITNSYGLHQGKPAQRGRRGMIAITYGMVGYPDRIKRFAPIALGQLPADCIEGPLTRHAARLLFAPSW